MNEQKKADMIGNRTPKYRGKQLHTAQWIYGSLINRGQRSFIIPITDYKKASETEVDPNTVQEFVGETDVNGINLWEGDRIEVVIPNGSVKRLIIVKGARGFIQITEEGERLKDWFVATKVLGNIKDIPDYVLPEIYDALNQNEENPWRCEKCGSLAIQQRVWADPNTGVVIDWDDIEIAECWCSACESHTRHVRSNELMAVIQEWWSATDFRQMEQITSYLQSDFDPEDGSKEFVDACNECWKNKTTEEKILVWNTWKNRI